MVSKTDVRGVTGGYAEIFNTRGGKYHAAMQAFPEARRREFELPVRLLALQAGERLLDWPSGGGYLRRYLPDGINLSERDDSDGFVRATGRDDLGMPVAGRAYDAGLSLTGLHHETDKRPIFRAWHGLLRPGGRVVIADAAAGSAVAAFLDGFVDAHVPGGHTGFYLDEAVPETLRSAGLDVLSCEDLTYPWVFVSRREAARFTRLLFGLRTELTLEHVEAALASELGFCDVDGAVGLNWGLRFIRAVRRG